MTGTLVYCIPPNPNHYCIFIGVNANGTGYLTLIELHTKGAADLGSIPDKSTIIIPLMQDNKLVAYKLVDK